jgi:hypothetical protein
LDRLRPIIGSSATGFGSDVWERDVLNNGSPVSTIGAIDMLGKSITTTGATDLVFEVPTGRSFIFKKI